MRIKPIEKPRGFMTRMAYAHSRRAFGRVITPTKVVGARIPGILPVYQHITKFMTQ